MALPQRHLVIDARCIRAQATGVGHSAARHLEGLNRLLADGLEGWKVSAIRLSRELDDPEFRVYWRGLNQLHIIDTNADPESHPRGDYWQQRQLPALLKRMGADVLFSPAYVGPLWKCTAARVTMIHDDLVWSEPGSYPLKFRLWLRAMMTRSARASEMVLFPSHDARVKCLTRLGIVPERTAPLLHGVDVKKFCPDKSVPREKLVLYIASRLPRKNHAVLEKALARIGISYHFPSSGDLREDDLIMMMRRAAVYAHPSRGEGFGLPVLEAMACGTPLVLSDLEVLRGIAGDAALYVDPDDEAGWAAAIGKVLEGGEEVAERVALGLTRAAEMTIEKTAERLLAKCEEALLIQRDNQSGK